jgi:hypothetical protein
LLIEVSKADSLRDDRPLREWASNPSLSDDHIIKHSQEVLGMMEVEGLYDMMTAFTGNDGGWNKVVVPRGLSGGE